MMSRVRVAHRVVRGARRALLACLAMFALFAPALFAPALGQPAAPSCATGPKVVLNAPHAAEALAARRALTIVAIGSSSTRGVGASSDERTYPAVLQSLLKAHFPGAHIRVLNRGVNGEDVPENLSRFERDVRDLAPDLVLWQVGTNYVIRTFGMGDFGTQLRRGIDAIQAWGADAILIDLQYSPWMNINPKTPAMNALIASTAAEAQASSFPRYALMKGWVEEQKVPISRMFIFDGLHMTDWAYDCFAKALAASLIPALEGEPSKVNQAVR